MASPPPLRSVSEAWSQVESVLTPLTPHRLPLALAAGHVLAEDIRLNRPHPPYDRVMMDGFALSSKGWDRGTRRFRIAGVQAAGSPPLRLTDLGTCIEVMTGCVRPVGCDIVVPVEQVTRHGYEVEIPGPVAAGQHIHPQGSDAEKGTVVLRSGQVLDAPSIGLAATAGRATLRVIPRPRIALVGTGSELVVGSHRPAAYQIASSNVPALAAGAANAGYAEGSRTVLPDDERALQEGLRKELRTSDLLVVTGGVSKGRFDVVPDVLQSLGVACRFHRVAQQPGRPMWFGVSKRGQPVFGLPGNPVAALVGFVRFVLPSLAVLGGRPLPEPDRIPLRHRATGPAGLTWYRPVRRTASGAEPMTMQNSGDLIALAGSTGFLEIPPGTRQGTRVAYWPWP